MSITRPMMMVLKCLDKYFHSIEVTFESIFEVALLNSDITQNKERMTWPEWIVMISLKKVELGRYTYLYSLVSRVPYFACTRSR